MVDRVPTCPESPGLFKILKIMNLLIYFSRFDWFDFEKITNCYFIWDVIIKNTIK